MKKVLLTLLLALALPVAAAVAQNIALGERVPEVKVPAWLGGEKPAATPRLTYVEFFHSSNPACTASLEQLRAITDKLGAKLRVVVVTRENEEKISPLLSPVPLAAHLRRTGHRRQDILGIQRAVRPVRGAGRQPEPGAVDGQLTAADTRNHRKIK